MNKYIITKEYEQLFNTFFLNIHSYFLKNTQTIHKARNELKTINYEGIATIVKAFKVPNIFNAFIYSYFRDSKAKKSYDNSIKIGDFAPQPIGYIEQYKFTLLKESYFVSEEFHYDFTIREPLLDTQFENRNKIFEAFARFTLALHNEGIFHNDFSPGNILIKKDNDNFIFKVVDVNRMTFITLSETMRAKNFSKLWAKEETLITMANEYKKHHECSNDFVNRVLHYSLQNKRVKNFKKFLKGKEIDW